MHKIIQVKKQRLLLASGGIILVASLFFFGRTVPFKTGGDKVQLVQSPSARSIDFKDLLAKAKEKLNQSQKKQLLFIEEENNASQSKQGQIKSFHQLADFWKDSAKVFEPYAYYLAEAAKLENSEKSLTFAAHLFLDNLMAESDFAMANWLAGNAKVLFDKALQINKDNDSSKIGLAACYILGNISGNPMEGILPVKEIIQRNPDNLYAQLILGLGGKKSGQYDKAIEHFNYILQRQPKNLEVSLHLAECYDLKGDKVNAVKLYEIVKQAIPNKEAKTELQNRINQLKN